MKYTVVHCALLSSQQGLVSKQQIHVELKKKQIWPDSALPPATVNQSLDSDHSVTDASQLQHPQLSRLDQHVYPTQRNKLQADRSVSICLGG